MVYVVLSMLNFSLRCTYGREYHAETLLCLQQGGHHRLDEYQTRGKEPVDEVQIYTWQDATLRELTELVKEVSTFAK
jgi:Sin3 associated polypeptide p18 (SAP18)